MLISEDLLLLLLDDEKGTVTGSTNLPPVLGGALLTEIALAGAVEVEEKPGMWRSAKVHVVTGARPDDPTLGAAYDVVAERPRTAQDLVTRLGKNRRDELAERLVGRGILARQDAEVLRLFPSKRWPTADPSHERDVRYRLTAALVLGVQPDERTAALIALLSAIDRAHKVADHAGLASKVVPQARQGDRRGRLGGQGREGRDHRRHRCRGDGRRGRRRRRLERQLTPQRG